ncbi:MAG: MaoC family dehydratase [Actinomycetota bacterium]|nr:MaoC family dehydratase [Actinomycetota bacterium]
MPNLTVTVHELAGLGETDLGWSSWFPVEQPRVDGFADATEDHQWIHVDPDRAAEGPFGTTIAHGYLTLSLIPRLLEDLLTISDQARGTNYGIDRARFTSPVKVGSRIRMRGRLMKVQPREDGGLQFKVRVDVHIEDQERPALVGEFLYLTYGA